MSSEDISQFVPAELRMSKKWETHAENMAVKAATGLVVGGIAAAVIFNKSKSPS
jgi:hypothetical protein